MTDTKPMLTVSQIAKEANVSRMTVYRWVDSGLLPTFKLGGSVRILPEDWEEFKAASRTPEKQD